MKSSPLSPHLTIYKPQITSVLSISHRATGFLLYLGLLILSWYLIFSRFGENSLIGFYLTFCEVFFASFLGSLLLFLFVFSFFYHLCNGVRHLFWDIGKGFSLRSVRLSGVIVIFSSVFLTALSFFLGFSKMLW